jgi:hypothetical protein
MNKKYLLVILAIVFFLWWTNKAKAQKPEPLPAPVPLVPEDSNLVWSSNNITIQGGDTFYKLASRIWDEEHAGPKTWEKVLNFARQNAVANGFNWDKYDAKFSEDLRDPDTLKPGQKVVMYTWQSFNENAPTVGLIMPGQQVNAFNSWETL